MKKAKMIYIIMNVIMILACAVLAAIKIGKGSWALYLIAPVIAAGFFAFMALPKTADPLKKLMRVVFFRAYCCYNNHNAGCFRFRNKNGKRCGYTRYRRRVHCFYGMGAEADV